MALNLSTLRNIMRNDSGIASDVVRLEQIVWLVFLKIYDSQEEDLEITNPNFKSIIPDKYKWRNWAVNKKTNDTLTGDDLLQFIDELFNAMKNLPVTPNTPVGQVRVRDVFRSGINNYSKDGHILRQVIDNIEENVCIEDAKNRHAFGEIYEEMLRLLQAAGSAGEFYTPRALTEFIIDRLDPKLGEHFADFTSGTGGFLTATLNHIRKEKLDTEKKKEQYRNAVFGQEWKPLPYLLSIANLMIHEVDSPDIVNGNSLSLYKEDIKDSEKFDVIGMNPPYGGSADVKMLKNYPELLRGSETADLFVLLIMNRLADKGRAGVIIPDGFLFGDGVKQRIKEKMLKEFNLHTIIRLPGSIFSPYTGIATNLIFFNKEKAKGAKDGFCTKETWFYRLDMPDGYKHFSRTKPMKVEHTQPIQDWWNNRQEIVSDETGEKSRVFTAQQLLDLDCNFDQCKFPKDEEEVLPPDELLRNYWQQREALDRKIDATLKKIEELLGIKL